MAPAESNSNIPTPLPLIVRRLRHQLLPLISVIACGALAAWIWSGATRAAVATGEVEAVRVEIHSPYAGVLEELPQPVNVFDSVQSGQVVARIDTGAAEAEMRRLEQELAQMQGASSSGTAATTEPSIAAGGANLAAQWYHTRIEELRERINKRDLKSPISGVVATIHHRPGETAVLGKALITIASSNAQYITGFLREDQMIRPEQGMSVRVRTRTRPTRTYLTFVETVGAQVELMPIRHWRNPVVQEWGRPIRVAMPTDAQLAPGELVDLTVSPAR